MNFVTPRYFHVRKSSITWDFMKNLNFSLLNYEKFKNFVQNFEPSQKPLKIVDSFWLSNVIVSSL